MSRASEYANSVSSLYAQIGEARGREAANKGAIWSGALANIGDFVAQYPQRQAQMQEMKDRAERTKLERDRAEREAAREQRDDDEDQRIRDLFKQAQDEWQAGQGGGIAPAAPGTAGQSMLPQPINAPTGGTMLPQPINAPTGGTPMRTSPLPTPSEILRAVGPKKAMPIINGLAALKKDPQGDPEKSLKMLQSVAHGLNALPEDMRAAAYPEIVKSFEQRGILQPGALPPTYDPTHWKFIMGTGQEPQKPSGLVAVPGPDGKPVYGTPKEGEPVYEKPLAASGSNPTETTLALAAAKGDKDAARALQVLKQQKASEGGPEPLVPIIGPDGKPVLVRRSQAEGKQPASSREQGRAVTSGDANRLAEIDNSLNDVAVLAKEIGTTGAGSKVGAMLPNVVTEMTGVGTSAKQRQALIDRVKQVIGKALEGGVLRKEDEYKYTKILPTIGDPPQVAKTKLEGLQRALASKREILLESLTDAGYDTSRFSERSTPAPAQKKNPFR